jgi:hypothetical protein
MSRVMLDESLRAKLNNLHAEVEFCDEAGRTVGYFVPADWHRELLYAWAKAQFTHQELETARKQHGGRSLTDILARLENSCPSRLFGNPWRRKSLLPYGLRPKTAGPLQRQQTRLIDYCLLIRSLVENPDRAQNEC